MTRLRTLLAVLLLLLAAGPALAAMNEEEDDEDMPAKGMPPAAESSAPLPGTPDRAAVAGGETPKGDSSEAFGGPLRTRNNLLGDPGGLRAALAARGLTFGLEEQSEVLGNVSGGIRRGAAYEGVLAMSVGLDTQKAGLWQGGTVNVSAYQIHGRGLSLDDLDNNLNTVSGLEAQRGALLFEAWYEQALFDNRLSVRAGQLAADQEFMISTYGELFINHAFGWSTLPSSDLPSGGPSFPLATPGVRLRATPVPALAVLLGIFNGDPAGPGTTTPQSRDASGTAFRLDDGIFAIAELQYTVNGGEHPASLPGTYKVGAWYDSERFADQRYGEVNLANGALPPGAYGQSHRGNWSVYVVADQAVYRPHNDAEDGIGVFARFMGAPGDRNLIDVYGDAGVTWKGLIPGREEDTAGIGFGFARISDTAIQADKAERSFADSLYPLRRHESVLELTYQAQIAPWWQVQPTAQYLFNLLGGAPNPQSPAKRLGDAAVLGLRTVVTF